MAVPANGSVVWRTGQTIYTGKNRGTGKNRSAGSGSE
ncbi:MAG: hypothetical protein RIS70_183, partial [Planctomycetota bacterium]